MTYEQILIRLGITQSLAEVMLVVGIVLIAVGFLLVLFWPYIVAGAMLFGVITVFSHSPNNDVVEVKPPVIEEVTEKKEYMEDCTSLTSKSEQCAELWKEREPEPVTARVTKKDDFKPASKVTLLDVDNQEYKSRRAEAIKKPGAVVMQTTYSDHDR